MPSPHARGLIRRDRSKRTVPVRWLAVAAVTLFSVFGFLQAPAVFAAGGDAPSLTILPSAVAPGQQLTVILRMGTIPANFTFPQCAVVDITSSVLAAKNGGVLAVTVTGPGSFYASATVPSATPPGSYGDPGSCLRDHLGDSDVRGDDGHAGHRRGFDRRCIGRRRAAPVEWDGAAVCRLGLSGLAAPVASPRA